LKGTHTGTITARFGLIWFSGFRGEDLNKQAVVEWSLDGPLSNLYPVIPTSYQDGRQGKNRKKGGDILIVHCSFSIIQNELIFLLQLHGKGPFHHSLFAIGPVVSEERIFM
jgi:hypothetical protein